MGDADEIESADRIAGLAADGRAPIAVATPIQMAAVRVVFIPVSSLKDLARLVKLNEGQLASYSLTPLRSYARAAAH
jgi:hypothetical protein